MNIIKNILEKHNISYNHISKATSGFTNLVYFIDDKYVIKLSNDTLIKKKLEKETSIYKNIKLTCIPKYVASGNENNYQYLIITKVSGKSLYSIWHTLSTIDRQNCIKQIAQILKSFNSQDTQFLSHEYKDLDFITYITNELKAKLKDLTQMGYEIKHLDDFISHKLPKLLNDNIYGLVYNDAHFDNFIYNNGKLTLIDFDRVRACPIDYEMLIFKTMCENPCKFASEEDEEHIKIEDYADIYETFKKEYPEMFTNKNVEKRIFIYQFNYLIGQAIKCKDNDFIKQLLSDFNKVISN